MPDDCNDDVCVDLTSSTSPPSVPRNYSTSGNVEIPLSFLGVRQKSTAQLSGSRPVFFTLTNSSTSGAVPVPITSVLQNFVRLSPQPLLSQQQRHQTTSVTSQKPVTLPSSLPAAHQAHLAPFKVITLSNGKRVRLLTPPSSTQSIPAHAMSAARSTTYTSRPFGTSRPALSPPPCVLTIPRQPFTASKSASFVRPPRVVLPKPTAAQKSASTTMLLPRAQPPRHLVTLSAAQIRELTSSAAVTSPSVTATTTQSSPRHTILSPIHDVTKMDDKVLRSKEVQETLKSFGSRTVLCKVTPVTPPLSTSQPATPTTSASASSVMETTPSNVISLGEVDNSSQRRKTFDAINRSMEERSGKPDAFAADVQDGRFVCPGRVTTKNANPKQIEAFSQAEVLPKLSGFVDNVKYVSRVRRNVRPLTHFKKGVTRLRENMPRAPVDHEHPVITLNARVKINRKKKKKQIGQRGKRKSSGLQRGSGVGSQSIVDVLNNRYAGGSDDDVTAAAATRSRRSSSTLSAQSSDANPSRPPSAHDVMRGIELPPLQFDDVSP